MADGGTHQPRLPVPHDQLPRAHAADCCERNGMPAAGMEDLARNSDLTLRMVDGSIEHRRLRVDDRNQTPVSLGINWALGTALQISIV